MSTDLLTIAMPVYERKDYFLEALKSALNQTVKCSVIVVDNCSSHSYFEKLCSEYNVSYYRNDENIGLFPNWNRCFELADSEYVMILGDDDILDPEYVELFISAKKNYPDIDIFFSDFVLNNLTIGKESSHKHVLPFGYLETGSKIIEFGIKHKLGYPLITSSIRKSKFYGFYTEFHASNDWLWIYQNADKLVFYGDSRKLYKYGIHNSQDSLKSLANCVLSTSYIYDVILKSKVSKPNFKKLASKKTFWSLVRLKSGASNEILSDFIHSDSIYGDFLKQKLDDDWLIRIIFKLPIAIVNLTYRSMRKLGIIS